MSKFASRVVSRMLRTRTGIISGGQPRILNVDRGVSFYGYAEVNTQATSPVARVKQHKAWFIGGASVQDGDLIQDRGDGKYYLVMSLKDELDGGEVAYIDGTLYYANATCSIQRFGTAGKNAFGRQSTDAPVTIKDGVYIMVNPLSMDVVDHDDRSIPNDKTKIVIQARENVQRNDRLVTSLGDTFIVEDIDRSSINNLWVLKVNQDSR